MKNKTFKEKLLFQGRKFLITLKRNYYIVPLIIVFAGCIQLMCSLYVLSPNFHRIAVGDYNCVFIFIICLFSILSTVAYLNYALVSYGQKRPLLMLILYLVMTVIDIVLLFIINNANNINFASELQSYLNALNNGEIAEASNLYTFVIKGQKTQELLLVQIVLVFVALAAVLTAPIIQAQLNKLKFKRIEAAKEDASAENK